jgi:hypothetical protein
LYKRRLCGVLSVYALLRSACLSSPVPYVATKSLTHLLHRQFSSPIQFADSRRQTSTFLHPCSKHLDAVCIALSPPDRLSQSLCPQRIHNIYTRAKMHSAIHQPTTTPQHLEDLEMNTPYRATKLTSTATRNGATGRGNAAGHGTATDEVQKKGQS